MKRTALKRKCSIRDGMLRKLKRDGLKLVFKRNGRVKKRKPLKKQSRALRTRSRVYFALTHEFLSREENRLCEICTRRREAGENILIQPATEVHHWAGRIGRLLCYVPYFKASCFNCREWPHRHPTKARDIGLLAPAALWNVFPESELTQNVLASGSQK